MQAVTDAMLGADDLSALHASVGAALADSRTGIAATWLYRRRSLQGPYELTSLQPAEAETGSACEAGTQLHGALVAACKTAIDCRSAQVCHVTMSLGLSIRGPRAVYVEPLSQGAADTPDGAIAFAASHAQDDAHLCKEFYRGLAKRIARAWRVHEQQARAQRIQSFLNNAMEAAYAGTWHIDLHTGQTLTSPTTNLLFGEPVTNQDIFGLVNRLIHPDDRDYIRKTYYEAIRTNTPYYHECRIIRRDGQVRWLCSHGIPVYGSDGKPAYVSGIITDITARVEDRIKLEQLAQSLQKAVGARDTFLARASHELKTPLTALQLLLENQQRKLARRDTQALETDKLSAVVNRSLAQIERLRCLIDNMMDVSRIDAQRLALEVCNCNLSQLVLDVAQEYTGRFAATGAVLYLEVQPDVTGQWDLGRLEQILTNLLNNTLRYAPGKKAWIRLKVERQHAVLSLEDDGPGVPSHLRPCLFENFRSGDSFGTMGGLGLGLHICSEIAYLHQGSLSYVAKDGCGAHFVLTVPLRALDNQTQQLTAQPASKHLTAGQNFSR